MMATIVEDSTLLFLCIFGSQLASVIIAIFGGVSTIILGSSPRLQPMTLTHTSTGVNPTFPVAVGCQPNFKYNHLTILHFTVSSGNIL